MDQSIIKTLTLPQRWGFSFLLSLMAWILPITLKAPPIVILISLMAAISGLGACVLMADDWRAAARRQNKMDAYHEELENYQLALDEEAVKREMVALAFGSASSESSVGSVPVQELSPAQRAEPLNQAPIGQGSGSGSGSVQDVNPLNRLYTPQNLTFDETAELIRRLSQTMTKTEIVESLWQVKKGGSKAYKAAMEEFKLITQ